MHSAAKYAIYDFLVMCCNSPDKAVLEPSLILYLRVTQPMSNMFFMVGLCNRADHYIFALLFLSSIFFPRLISAAAGWMSTTL